MNKHTQIEELRKEQKIIKEKITSIKTKVPTNSVIYVLCIALFIYFFENKMYAYFGGSLNFMKTAIVFFGVIGIFFLYKSYLKIKKNEKLLDSIRGRMYKIMRLED